jgi:hypothetical protein
MLLDRAAKLQAALASHQTLKAAGQQGEVYQTRARQLKPLADDLARAKQDWKAAVDSGLAPGTPSPKPGLKAYAAELLRRFREDPNVLAEPDEEFRFQFTPGLKNAAEEFGKLATEAWSARLNAQAQFPADAVLRALEQIPAYRSSVQRIRDAASEVQRLKDNRPPAAELNRALAQLDAAIRKKDDALVAMQGDDLPAEVQAFLRKTGQGGAEISDLTTGVLTWLNDRGLAGTFRIVPSRG